MCLPVYRFSVAFGYGLSAGFEEDGNRNEEEISIPVNVVFEPTLKSYAAPSDSIEVSREGTLSYVAYPRRGYGSVRQDARRSIRCLTYVFALCNRDNICAYHSVHTVHSQRKPWPIFDSTNVVRLARIGWMLIAAGLLEVCSGISQTFLVGAIGFVSDGYMLKASWLPPFSEMLLGLFALMLAAIWKRGLAMQKEQELTI